MYCQAMSGFGHMKTVIQLRRRQTQIFQQSKRQF